MAPGQGSFSDGRAEDPAGCSDSEDEEPLTPTEDVETHDSPKRTNLFASAITRTSLKGGRSRKTDVVTESSSFSHMDRPMRKEHSTSAERRELGKSLLESLLFGLGIIKKNKSKSVYFQLLLIFIVKVNFWWWFILLFFFFFFINVDHRW